MSSPPVQYAMSGDVEIAYQVLGEGPPDLVWIAGATTHLDVFWEHPSYRRFCEQLTSFSRLIVFDKRGMGLSERTRVGTLEERMDDVRAVLDAVGSEQAALMGVSEGGPMSMLFAATHPERTQALLLVGAEVKEETTEDWPWGESTREEFDAYAASIGERWGKGLAAALYFPDDPDPEWTRRWFGKLQTASMTPRDALAFQRMAFEIDVRDVVPAVRVPTLVVHRVDDTICHVENARFLADRIPGARYVELRGSTHIPWAEGSDEILAEIREFLTGVREAPEPDRVLTTVLFTDIVGSTGLATELGDRRWRELLQAHHAAIRRELERFRVARSTRPATGSWRPSTGLRGRSAAAGPRSMPSSRSVSRSGLAYIPASARSSATSWLAWPSTSAPALPPRPGPARCSSPGPCTTSSRDPGSG